MLHSRGSVSPSRKDVTVTAHSSTFSSQLWTLTQARQLTGKAHLVLQALASCTGLHGTFPTQETLAARAGCSIRTVIRALDQAYALGLVERTRRMVRRGNRFVRTSNAYRLLSVETAAAKQAAMAYSQKLREALKRRKQRLFDLRDKKAAEPMPLFNYPSRTPLEWLELLAKVDAGMTPEEAGYRT